MAANRKVKVAYLWSFNNFIVYSRVFKVSELIELVFKMIVRQGHSQKVILKVKFKENISSEGFSLSHIRLQWIFLQTVDLYKMLITKFSLLIFVIPGSIGHLLNQK